MKTYNFSAAVNYPDDEVDIPQFNTLTPELIEMHVRDLLLNEPDATSFQIIITVNPENKE